jgi:hypothetical protein
VSKELFKKAGISAREIRAFMEAWQLCCVLGTVPLKEDTKLFLSLHDKIAPHIDLPPRIADAVTRMRASVQEH